MSTSKTITFVAPQDTVNHLSYYESIIVLSLEAGQQVHGFVHSKIAKRLEKKFPEITLHVRRKTESAADLYRQARHFRSDVYIIEQCYGTTWGFIRQFMQAGVNKKTYLTIHNVNSWVFPAFSFNPKALLINLLHIYITRKLRGVVVVNENLKNYIITKSEGSVNTAYIPFVLPKLSESVPELSPAAHKTIRLVIPGTINTKRRDYTSIVTAFKTYLKYHNESRLNLILLGRPTNVTGETKTLLNDINQINKSHPDTIKYWDAFVSEDEYEMEMQQADGLIANLNLVYQYNTNVEIYGQTKESGLTAMMLQYRKPCIVYNAFDLPGNLPEHTVLVNSVDELSELFGQLHSGELDLSLLNKGYETTIQHFRTSAKNHFNELVNA